MSTTSVHLEPMRPDPDSNASIAWSQPVDRDARPPPSNKERREDAVCRSIAPTGSHREPRRRAPVDRLTHDMPSRRRATARNAPRIDESVASSVRSRTGCHILRAGQAAGSVHESRLLARHAWPPTSRQSRSAKTRSSQCPRSKSDDSQDVPAICESRYVDGDWNWTEPSYGQSFAARTRPRNSNRRERPGAADLHESTRRPRRIARSTNTPDAARGARRFARNAAGRVERGRGSAARRRQSIGA